jgi:hypothetical protein
MLIRSLRPAQGIRFAWLPVDTPEGRVWLEHVHYRWVDSEFGGYRYERVYYKSCPTWHDRVVDYSRCSWGAEQAVPKLGDNWKPQYDA